MERFTIGQGDTRPELVTVLEEEDTGDVIDLTGATVTFTMTYVNEDGSLADAPTVDDEPCSVTDETGGEVSYTFTSADTATAGEYDAEFQITFGDGGIETVPNDK